MRRADSFLENVKFLADGSDDLRTDARGETMEEVCLKLEMAHMPPCHSSVDHHSTVSWH